MGRVKQQGLSHTPSSQSLALLVFMLIEGIPQALGRWAEGCI